MHQRRADERVDACILQLAVPGDQCFEQAPDVAPVLWRLVASAVLRTADLGGASLGGVAEKAGAVVGVRQIVGDQAVHLGHEVDRQLPARIERSLSCAFVGGLDVEHPPLLDLLHLRGIEVDGGACFILGERAAFDRVGPVDAAGDHLALELIRHLRERRGDEAPMGILDALHRKLQAASVDAHLKEEGAEAVGFDAQRELGNLGGDHVCRNVRSKKQNLILFSMRWRALSAIRVRPDVQRSRLMDPARQKRRGEPAAASRGSGFAPCRACAAIAARINPGLAS